MRKPFLLSSVVTAVTAATFCIAGAASVHGQGFTHVVAFGDSLTDRGNTYELAHAIPGLDELFRDAAGYDDAYYNSAFNPDGTPAGGRFSSGPTWVEYLNARIIGSTQAAVDLGRHDGGFVTTGTNFAWAASTARSVGALLPVPHLSTQIGYYNSDSTLTPYASTTLYTVWSGGNDGINWVKSLIDDTPGHEDMAVVSSEAVAAIITAIESIYATGGRTIVVPNLPALGFKPDFREDDFLRENANNFVNLFNASLASSLDDLNLEGLQLLQLDVFSVFNDILADPEAFGFTNTTDMAFTYAPDGNSSWVDDPSQYVFWENTHPTSYVHQILGELAYDQLMPIPEPSTYALIGVGAALGFWVRRRRLAA